MFLLIIIQHLIIYTNSEIKISKKLISEGTKPFMLGYTEDTNTNYYLIFTKQSNTYRYKFFPDLTYTDHYHLHTMKMQTLKHFHILEKIL